MIEFPSWSDLGGVSPEQRDMWEAESARRAKYRRYFDGKVFEERVPLEYGSDEQERPLLYPVGINLVKMLCLAQADALFGEWDDDIVRWRVRHDVQETEAARSAIRLLATILHANNASSLFHQMAVDREVYGGCAFKVSPDLGLPGFIRISRVDLDDFFPVWDPDSPDDLLEVWVITRITREQARAKYGIDVKKDVVERVEHWTLDAYENYIDGRRVDAFSGINPWRIVPFGYIPRMRTISWWGDALTPDIIPVQDELNMRIADLGDAVNYNSHPVRYGLNLPRRFNARNFPLGPNAFWDLGRTIGNSPPPQVGLLEVENPIPQRALDFIKFLYDWSRTSAFAPPIAFGEDQGGGQRSGRTLEIRMWPLLRATRRSRAYFAAGLTRMAKIAARILLQKNFEGISSHALRRILDGTIVPAFWPLLPRDEQAIVDRIVKLMTLPVPAVSLETAVKMLGMGPSEVERIRDMLTDELFSQKFRVSGIGNEASGEDSVSN